MRIFGCMIGALPLLGALLLLGCGGGGEGPHDQQAGQGVAVGGAPQTDEFIKLAQAAGCARTANRLYLIDQKMVFWNRADLGCFDAAYARTLYGATPQALLCSTHDSIAGPVTSCTDAQYRAMFDIILKNLDSADLGLGSTHKVEAITFVQGQI